MSYGTISPFQLANQFAIYATLANGNTVALSVAFDALGGLEASTYVKWAWDVNFTALGAFTLATSEYDAVQQIMTSAGLWNQPMPSVNGVTQPTWAACQAGASYLSTDGNTYSGDPGVAKAFQDFVAANTTATDETATNIQYVPDVLISGLQNWLITTYSGLATPAAPTSTFQPGDVQFPPQKVGAIVDAVALIYAQCTRLTLSANGNVPALGISPVPQS